MSGTTITIESMITKDVNLLKQVKLNLVRTSRSTIIFSSLFLLFCSLFLSCLCVNAETLQTIYLNDGHTSSRFQSVNDLPCSGQACFQSPNDAVIASDGSFVVVADSVSSSSINLRRFNFSSNSFIDAATIPLSLSSSSAQAISIALNNKNNKVAVHREPLEGEASLIQVVDLPNNSVKELSSISSNSKQISAPDFLDKEGAQLIAGTLDLNLPELVVIDVGSDVIASTVPLEDVAQSVEVSPNFKKAVITYSNDLAQSVSVFDIASNGISTINLTEEVLFDVEEFLGKITFDLTGNLAAISSVGGKHVAHFLDLTKNELSSLVLDQNLEGSTVSTISSDGMTVISAGSILNGSSIGFKVYKSSVKSNNSLSTTSSAAFLDGSVLLDVDISPDQSKIFILTIKNGTEKLKVIDYKNLTQTQELNVSNSNAESFLVLDPFGRYAVSPNVSTDASLSIISDLNLGPVFKSITPNIAPLSSSFSFVIDGFVDLTRFADDLKVCFKNNSNCASNVFISKEGKVISGTTPKVSQPGLVNLILTANSNTGKSIFSSTYEDAFQFVKDFDDDFLPEITILAPEDGSAFNTKRVLVLGSVDGTGSDVETVTVNGKEAKLDFGSTVSESNVNFIGEVEFTEDGTFEIKVVAEDDSSNTIEETIEVTVDTVLPSLIVDTEATGVGGQFRVTGIAGGTGSDINSITINSEAIEFTPSEEVSFEVLVTSIPIDIVVVDKAGNKKQLQIANPLSSDKVPPEITVSSPENGQIIRNNPNISVNFTVTDDVSVESISLNGTDIPVASNDQYVQSFTLFPGENLISIVALDSGENKTTTRIRVSYIPSFIAGGKGEKDDQEAPKEKEVITLASSFEDLNLELLDKLTGDDGQLTDIGSTTSVELSNPPPIPTGDTANVNKPVIEDEENPASDEIAKGFSFVTDVKFEDDGTVTVQDEEKDDLFTAILIDNTGRTFVVGFAFLRELAESGLLRTKHKFQTTGGTPLGLVTTLTIPGDASEGDARISIIKENESLATIPLQINPPRDVKLRKKTISSPQILEPIKAVLRKDGRKLKLKIKGTNLLKRIAIIDGQLEKLTTKGNFFTNVTFVPSDGIKIKRLRVKKKRAVLVAEIEGDIEAGVRLFNLITPRGTDIGGIIIPENLKNGKLETSAEPESLLLKEG